MLPPSSGLDSSVIMIERACSSAASVTIYQTAWGHVSEYNNLYSHRYDYLKFNIVIPCGEAILGPQVRKSSALKMGRVRSPESE
jgi:hypothetical protein